ncbi:MAG: 30S ribosomal protein S20 [Bacilli bacterium]|jgi:small subunit ribosomal protein S20
MPNIKSAKKRVKVAERKREENSKVKKTMKTAIKKALTNNNDQSLNEAYKKIDKAVKKGVIKKNTAAKKKSKLTTKINQTKQSNK